MRLFVAICLPSSVELNARSLDGKEAGPVLCVDPEVPAARALDRNRAQTHGVRDDLVRISMGETPEQVAVRVCTSFKHEHGRDLPRHDGFAAQVTTHEAIAISGARRALAIATRFAEQNAETVVVFLLYAASGARRHYRSVITDVSHRDYFRRWAAPTNARPRLSARSDNGGNP